MFARTLQKFVAGGFPVHRDTQKTPRMMKEVGQWLYQPSTMQGFRQWCKEKDVRAYGSIKMTSTPHFARCLRATRRIYPGEAIISCPHGSGFNFLTVAKEQQQPQQEDVGDSSGFPLPINWRNYDERLSFLKSTSVWELAMAGWMVRISSLETSAFAPYINYLLEDTRGRDGIAHGLSKEREDASGMVDHYFSEIATEAGEDPEVFLEQLFRAFACLHHRTQPIEAEAIQSYIPGTDFFKARLEKLYVPTLFPLIDAVPQVEDDTQNTVLQFFPDPCSVDSTGGKDDVALLNLAKELQIPMAQSQNVESRSSSFSVDNEKAPEEERRAPFLHRDSSTPYMNSNSNSNSRDMSVQPFFNRELLRGGGLFALRAIQVIEEGDVLYLRHFPSDGDAAQHGMNANVIEANRLLSHDN